MASLGRSANVSRMQAKRAGRRLSGKTVPAATRAAQCVCMCIEPPPLGVKAYCQLLLSYYPLPTPSAAPTSSQKLWVMLSLMVGSYLLALICQRTREPLHALVLSAVLILLLEPAATRDIAFQLSFI